MAHITKILKGEVAALIRHDSRQQADEVEHSNECIDDTRTHLNYNLAPERFNESGERLSDYQAYKQRLSEVKVFNRADVIHMCSWVVTVPKDLPESKHKMFFKVSYDFLKNLYGEQNIVTAYVHMDETTPHMHFKFLPVVKDEKGEKLKCKQILNRQHMRMFHPELQKYLEKQLQCEVNVLNGATANGNRTVNKLRSETAQAKLEEIQVNLNSKNEELQFLNKNIPDWNKAVAANKSIDDLARLPKFNIINPKAYINAVEETISKLKNSAKDSFLSNVGAQNEIKRLEFQLEQFRNPKESALEQLQKPKPDKPAPNREKSKSRNRNQFEL